MVERRIRKDGTLDFIVKAKNGHIVFYGEHAYTEIARENGIMSMRISCKKDESYDMKESDNGKLYFNLKAYNGHIIGHSPMYESISARENGVQSLKINSANDLNYFEY